MRTLAVLAILFGAFPIVTRAEAQTRFRSGLQDSAQGTISGRVRTVGGTALSGASVEVINTQTSEKRIIAAGEEGAFRISGLQTGKYRVIVRARGYLENAAAEVEIAAGTGQELEVALKRQHPDEPIRTVVPF